MFRFNTMYKMWVLLTEFFFLQMKAYFNKHWNVFLQKKKILVSFQPLDPTHCTRRKTQNYIQEEKCRYVS